MILMGNWKVTRKQPSLSFLARESSVCTVYCITTDVLWCTVHVGYVTAHITFARRKHENQEGRFFYVTVASITYPIFFSTYILFRFGDLKSWTRNFHVWLHPAVFLNMPTKVEQNKLELLLRVASKKISNHSIDPKYVPNNEIKTITIYGNKK